MFSKVNRESPRRRRLLLVHTHSENGENERMTKNKWMEEKPDENKDVLLATGRRGIYAHTHASIFKRNGVSCFHFKNSRQVRIYVCLDTLYTFYVIFFKRFFVNKKKKPNFRWWAPYTSVRRTFPAGFKTKKFFFFSLQDDWVRIKFIVDS